MIAYVRGTLLAAFERGALVDTPSGVGYEVNLTGAAISRLPAKGEEVGFYTETVVREDAIELFGFESLDERTIFRILTSISGLGPRKALAILSLFGPAELARVVFDEDLGAITRVSGIGKKTGQQILLELRFKLDKEGAAGFAPKAQAAGGVFADAVAGLANLGYAEHEASDVVRAVLDDEPDLDVAEALRQSLKRLARKNS